MKCEIMFPGQNKEKKKNKTNMSSAETFTQSV